MIRYDHDRLYRQRHKEKIKRYRQRHYKTIQGYLQRIVWRIRQRCNNPKHVAYKYYGNRGIKLCFTSAELYQWVIANSVKPRDKQIHRIDHNGDYRLDNIEFLRPKNHFIKHNHKRDVLGRFH